MIAPYIDIIDPGTLGICRIASLCLCLHSCEALGLQCWAGRDHYRTAPANHADRNAGHFMRFQPLCTQNRQLPVIQGEDSCRMRHLLKPDAARPDNTFPMSRSIGSAGSSMCSVQLYDFYVHGEDAMQPPRRYPLQIQHPPKRKPRIKKKAATRVP